MDQKIKALIPIAAWGAIAVPVGYITQKRLDRGKKSKSKFGANFALGFLAGAAAGGIGYVVAKYLLRDAPATTGLLNVQRMGLYIPAPTVKKFSSFTGTRYYS